MKTEQTPPQKTVKYDTLHVKKKRRGREDLNLKRKCYYQNKILNNNNKK